MHCYPDTNAIDIRNNGGVKFTAQNFSLVDGATGTTLNTSALQTLQTLAPGESNSTVPVMYDLTAGSIYKLRATNFPDIQFPC
jgi:hypothetical protein